MMSIWPAIAAGIRPDQVPMVKAIGTPTHANVARARSASNPIRFVKSFGSRWLNGTLSPSCPILTVLAASDGYLVAALSGSHPTSLAREDELVQINKSARPAALTTPDHDNL